MHTRYRVIPMESISQLLVNESRHLATTKDTQHLYTSAVPLTLPPCHQAPRIDS